MPSNKSFYDGCVVISNAVDTLDVSGWINRKASADYNKGTRTISLNSSVATFVKVGDFLMKSITNELIGRVELVNSAEVVISGGTKVSLAEDDYVEVYPKFDIVKVDIIGPLTYISVANPVTIRSVGDTSPDLGTFSANPITDYFGAVRGNGASSLSTLSAVPEGTSIEGRWKRIQVDNSGDSTNHAAICYLKATPTIM